MLDHFRLADDSLTFAQHLITATQQQQIMLLNRQARYSTRMITLLKQHYGDALYFYGSIVEEATPLSEWLLHLSHDPGFPIGFGQALRQELRSSDHPNDWGTALARDLNQLAQQPILLVLDRFDKIQADSALPHFIRALSEHLSSHLRVLLSTHAASTHWQALMADGVVLTLDTQAELKSHFNETILQGHLEVYALRGWPQVQIDQYAISSWDGLLPKHLFFFFVDRPQVTRQQVFEAFWPTLSTQDATNIFHVTKRKITEKLGHDLIRFEKGVYIPNPHLVRFYDVEQFERLVQAALVTPEVEVAKEKWQAALALYRGHFLKDIKAAWAVQRRAALKNLYVQALTSLGAIYRESRNHDLALAYYTRAAAESPEREDICRHVMALYAEQGRLDTVANEYKRLEECLKVKFNTRPGVETRTAYQHYLQN